MARRNNPDQFQLRLPPGLRDRIKAYADRHGRSMNAEIVRLLEREFPPLAKVDEVAESLLRMLRVIEPLDESEPMRLLAFEILQTVEGIASGRVTGVSKEARGKVSERYDEFLEYVQEYAEAKHLDTMDDDELESVQRGLGTAKFVDLDDEPER